MDDYCDYMFKIPLLHLSIKNWEQKKLELLNMMNEVEMSINEGEHIKTDYYTKQNTKFTLKHNQRVTEILKEEIQGFCNYFNFCYYKVSMSWFQTASKGNYHGIHNHGAVGYSSVCFIDYDPKEHTPTQFVSPFHNFITGDFLEYGPEVKEGSIIFFPSVIMHYTEPNQSDKQRTILSFNIDVKENHNQRPRYS